MGERYEVVLETGALRSSGATWIAPHRWTPAGVSVHGAFTGAHLLHAAVGACVLNDVHREADLADLRVDGVRVTVRGGFDPSWASTGVEYEVVIDGLAGGDAARLIELVDAVAEIPRALAAGVPVARA